MWIKRRIAIKDHAAEANLFARRAIIALILVVIMVGLLLSNLYNLQVNKYSDYQTRADGNRIKVQPVAPNRGLIFDTQGVLLAKNTPVHSLDIIAEDVKDIDALLVRIKTLIEVSADQEKSFRRALKQNRRRRFKPISLIDRLTDKQTAIIAVNQHLLDGVLIDARLKRDYPYADLLTHALGYVAKINPKDAARIEADGLDANYAATRDIGKLGLEKYYQNLLHGDIGYRKVEVNSRGRVLREMESQAPTPGNNLHLHLDIELQKVAQQQLLGNRGAVVVLNAVNNGILALYSNPSYDPNLFVHGISSKNYNALLASKDRPLINRSTQGQYPPASTIKPLIGLLGLEQGLITEKTKMWDPGYYQINDLEHKYRDWKKWGHGHVDIYKSLEESCDTFFYDLALRLGVDAISEKMVKFGFGEMTGVDIFEESSANMPSRAWKAGRFRQSWYAGDTVSIGIGQGYWTSTPLQIALATSVLANEGQFFEPKLLNAIESSTGKINSPAQDRPPIVLKHPNNWKIIKRAMRNTVEKPTGTAHKAFVDTTYQAAGKTGTGQVIAIAQDAEYDKDKIAERHRDNALFVGFAPFDNPKIVVAIVVENAGGGSSNAAPIARQIMDTYFAKHPLAADSLIPILSPLP
ncbi:penicillin-binding protein 2 [Algibacillus agarilyticus]|uniref:penicillin-binding protein 2 n=1 Tax=Algibacillus agarilyticus TaxID=2234133 RepID=UPI000DD07F05|nr:penicillin-binding protein 2 [Algibacillus agarilyticus]